MTSTFPNVCVFAWGFVSTGLFLSLSLGMVGMEFVFPAALLCFPSFEITKNM